MEVCRLFDPLPTKLIMVLGAWGPATKLVVNFVDRTTSKVRLAVSNAATVRHTDLIAVSPFLHPFPNPFLRLLKLVVVRCIDEVA